jgi:hypothetical protein
LLLQDIASGKEVMTPVPMTSGDVVWANDNTTLVGVIEHVQHTADELSDSHVLKFCPSRAPAQHVASVQLKK